MTELRKRMIEGLQLRGLSARTQAMYVRAVRQLAEPYHKSPDRITAEELRQYFLDIKNVMQYSRSASTIALGGITFVYEHTLPRDGTTLRFVRAPREKTLPVSLSFAEIRGLLGCVRLPRYRVDLSTIYSWGLRLQEGTHLQVRAIDSSRMLLHVRHGKGGKERYVPRPHRTLALLRQSWGTPRHPVLIFPAPGRGGTGLSTATAPMPRRRGQAALREALQDSGIHKQASVHTLRHAWATPLLEAGVKLRRMQAYRGHNSPPTTSVYTPLTASAAHLGADAINRLMEALGWWRALRLSAAMAPRTGPNLATGCCPVICGPCRTLSGAARRRSAATSITGRPAASPIPAIPPGRPGPALSASRTRPSTGWNTRRRCCYRSLTAW